MQGPPIVNAAAISPAPSAIRRSACATVTAFYLPMMIHD